MESPIALGTDPGCGPVESPIALGADLGVPHSLIALGADPGIPHSLIALGADPGVPHSPIVDRLVSGCLVGSLGADTACAM